VKKEDKERIKDKGRYERIKEGRTKREIKQTKKAEGK
jgi:hypothetical protein